MISRDKKLVDAIIMSYKPKDTIYDSLCMLLRQTIHIDKIIIYNTCENSFFDNLSIEVKDKIKKLLDNNKNIEVYHIEKKDFDHGRSRNAAFKLTSSKYVLFMTDDAVAYDEKMCENMISAFNENVATVYAKQVPRSDASITEKLVRAFNYGDTDIKKNKSTENMYGIKNIFTSNSCAMYDRDIFLHLGMFTEGIVQNEDTLFVSTAVNCGYDTVYCSTAKVVHSHNLSLLKQYRRNFDIGTIHEKYKDVFSHLRTESQGKLLVIYVTKNLIKGMHLFSLIYFYIECVFRYIGYKNGKRYQKKYAK